MEIAYYKRRTEVKLKKQIFLKLLYCNKYIIIFCPLFFPSFLSSSSSSLFLLAFRELSEELFKKKIKIEKCKNVFEKSFRKEEEFHQSSKLFERKIRNIEGFDPFTNDWKNIIENTPVLDKV